MQGRVAGLPEEATPVSQALTQSNDDDDGGGVDNGDEGYLTGLAVRTQSDMLRVLTGCTRGYRYPRYILSQFDELNAEQNAFEIRHTSIQGCMR